MPLSAVPEILKSIVAFPSFLELTGRLTVNEPVLAGDTPDSAAAASEAAMLTLAVAARTGKTTESHAMKRPKKRSANLYLCPEVEPVIGVKALSGGDFILSWLGSRSPCSRRE